MSEAQPTVTGTVDGHTVTVPKGTTILEAAESVGIRVPHYCYHPGLSSPAQCRLCLVEVEGAPKLQASCVTELQDGQVVHTEGEQAKAMREGVLEFYLANHPLDCPICDQSGECKLQDYVHAEGRMHGRSREPKRVFGRDDFGGDVLFYGDRCVMCTRCVRFMNEVAQDARLTVVDRGNRSIIDTFFEHGVEGSPFAGNIVDICPVGALVSKDFLHKARAWDLDHTPSVCPNCSQGCNVDLHTRDNLVQRLKPRTNPEVNGHWMCDFGRDNYEWMNRRDRLESPWIASDGNRITVDWDEALTFVSQRLQRLGATPVKVLASPHASTEDLAALAALVHQLGGGEMVYRSRRAPDEVPLPGFPSLVRRRDLSPNATGAELMGVSRVGGDEGTGGLDAWDEHTGILIVLGDELGDFGPRFGGIADFFLYVGSYPTEAASSATAILPSTTFAEQEGTLVNVDGRVQRCWPGLHPPGAARPAWMILSALTERLGGAAAPERAAQAFLLAAELSPALEGLTHESIGTGGALVSEPAALVGSAENGS